VRQTYLSCRPARLHRLAESIPGLPKRLQIRALTERSHMQDFALGLSILVKGSEEEKLRWTFNMYDLNGDGVITRDEMEDVVASVSQSLSTDSC
jgi:Ca2+-binding EF-hand superfamily protein